MQLPANLLAQTLTAAYFVAIYLVFTSPVGIVLFVAAASVRASGSEAREPIGVPAGVLRRAAVAAVLGTAGMIVLGGYHGSYWFEHRQQPPGRLFTIAVETLLAAQLVLVVWVVHHARRRDVAMLWGALWLWVQLVAALVASGGPALGAL